MARHHFLGAGPRRTVGARRGLALAAAALGVVMVAGTLPALAGLPTVGDPQPELAKFSVGATGGTGSGVVLADNVIVLASPSKSGTTINVCILHPTSRSCVNKVSLSAYHSGGNQDEFFGPIGVFSSSPSVISIVAYDCCYIGANGIVLYLSTDGGATFGGPYQAGDLGALGAATDDDGTIVAAVSTSGLPSPGGTQVQAFSPGSSVPQTSFAAVSPYEGNVAITSYHGGVLVAEDNLTNTRVEYAPAGSGLNSSSSYKTVGSFNNEQTVAISGDALLTDPGGSLTGGERLRLFNGTSFGPAYRVPEPKSPDDGYFAEEVTDNVVHVFFIARRSGYDLMTESTTNGKVWSPLEQLSSAIDSDALSPVLDPLGNGVVFENDGTPLFAQPILNPQSVHLSVGPSHVRVGHTAVISGGAAHAVASANPVITLEELNGGRWYPVKTTHGQAHFTFTVPAKTATYRAVESWIPGYFQYGYSNAVTVIAVR
jgi:hypothetical protein